MYFLYISHRGKVRRAADLIFQRFQITSFNILIFFGLLPWSILVNKRAKISLDLRRIFSQKWVRLIGWDSFKVNINNEYSKFDRNRPNATFISCEGQIRSSLEPSLAPVDLINNLFGILENFKGKEIGKEEEHRITLVGIMRQFFLPKRILQTDEV